ncbi:hypothetical protein [Enterococcus sp. DIV2421]
MVKRTHSKKQITVYLLLISRNNRSMIFYARILLSQSTGMNYEKFLAKQAKIAEEESRKQSDFFPQFFGHSRFIKSKNFIRHVNDQQIEVIANVTRTIDSLNQEGKSTKTLENEGLFQIWYVFDSATKHFLVERYQPIEISEKESKEYAE